MQTIHLRGHVAAIADLERAVLAPAIDVLPDEHPDKQFVAFMCLYARDVMTGARLGPYSGAEAERYARACMIRLANEDEHPAHLHDLDEEPDMTTSQTAAPIVAARPRSRAEQLRDLWAMTPAQRVAAMYRGDLSLLACCAWAARYPDEVPRIQTGTSPGGEFAFLAAFEPDVAEA